MPPPASGSGWESSAPAAGKLNEATSPEKPGLALQLNGPKTGWSEINQIPSETKKPGSQPRRKTLEGIRQVGAPFSCRLAGFQQGPLSHPALERLRDFIIHAISHPTASCISGGKPELITFPASQPSSALHWHGDTKERDLGLALRTKLAGEEGIFAKRSVQHTQTQGCGAQNKSQLTGRRKKSLKIICPQRDSLLESEARVPRRHPLRPNSWDFLCPLAPEDFSCFLQDPFLAGGR